MLEYTQHILERNDKKPILIDYTYKKSDCVKPIIIFAHGYKGFKDWGAWSVMAQAYASAGFCFVKFNFSHNGGTMEDPIDFPDLEAFANNNYSKELNDLNDVITWSKKELLHVTKSDTIYVIGHSRGGGIAILCAAQNKSIKKLVTLASVSDYKSRFPTGDAFEEWKKKGVFYIKNGRTHQEMPHYFQFFEDFQMHKDQLEIKHAARRMQIPHLIIHGTNDPTVSVQEAFKLHEWSLSAELRLIRGANHVFGARHPWDNTNLPTDLRSVTQCVINFLK